MKVNSLRDASAIGLWPQYVLPALVIATGIALSLFVRWEMSGESWGYWYFAKVFASGGGLVTIDRSPLYVAYLAPFTLLPYPASVLLEYLLTTFITCAALYALLKTQIGAALALLFTLAAMFFLQQWEPPGQKLALACVCGALLLRLRTDTRSVLPGAYALMMAAVLFRSSFMMFAASFAVYDLYRLYRYRNALTLDVFRPKPAADWPLYAVLIFVAVCKMFPSVDVWNNVWMATTRWFPFNDNSLAAASIIGHYNWHYIISKYGSFDDHDFYFTHLEAYKGALTVSGMFLANPALFTETLLRNVLAFFPSTTLNFPLLLLYHKTGALSVALFAVTMTAAFFHSSNLNVRAFVVGGVMAVLVTVISMPKARYMFPLLPLSALGAVCIGARLRTWFIGTDDSPADLKRHLPVCLMLILIGAALFFMAVLGLRVAGWIFLAAGISLSTVLILAIWIKNAAWRACMLKWTRGGVVWVVACIFSFNAWEAYAESLRNAMTQVVAGNLHLLETAGPTSMRRSYSHLQDALRGCHGVMSMEYTFIGAFLAGDSVKLYDVWEIPPFPSSATDAPPYVGLDPQRIDCVLESADLTTTIGMGTNVHLRYKYYLQPYIAKLVESGATVI